MIADLIDKNNDVRLITTNVLSVFSTNKTFTDNFIVKLKNSNYLIDNKIVDAKSIISTINKFYNIYENVYCFIKTHKTIDHAKVFEYLSYFDLDHILWMKLNQLDKDSLLVLHTLIQLASDKPIVITEYIDSCKYKHKLYSLLFNIGLTDRLIIVPFTNLEDAVNNSTCQCYVKSDNAIKMMSRFPVEFLNYEFNTETEYYHFNSEPAVYDKKQFSLQPTKYKHTFYDLLLIYLYSIKMLLISVFNWSTKIHESRLHT